MSSERRATFILRLWRDREMEAGQWRSEVTYVQTGTVARFASLTSLFRHLQSLLDAANDCSISSRVNREDDRLNRP